MRWRNKVETRPSIRSTPFLPTSAPKRAPSANCSTIPLSTIRPRKRSPMATPSSVTFALAKARSASSPPTKPFTTSFATPAPTSPRPPPSSTKHQHRRQTVLRSPTLRQLDRLHRRNAHPHRRLPQKSQKIPIHPPLLLLSSATLSSSSLRRGAAPQRPMPAKSQIIPSEPHASFQQKNESPPIFNFPFSNFTLLTFCISHTPKVKYPSPGHLLTTVP